MQSPENVESNKSIHSSKLHTPCRQIGLRRKKSRVSYTPIKENKSPEIKTDAAVGRIDSIPTTPTLLTVGKIDRTPTTPALVTVGKNESTPTLVNVSNQVVSTDKNQSKENCRSQKAAEEKKFTPTAFRNSGNSQDIKREIEAIKKRIKEKEEKIAALKLAKLYRRKHDTDTLSELTERWREGCQAALQELLKCSAARGYQINMTQLISQLGIPFQLIRYDPESEDFE